MKWNGVISFRNGLLAGLSAFIVLCVAGPALAVDVSGGGQTGPTHFIFAASWQPGFCEIRPEREECEGQTAARTDASRFSLHGLWPVKQSYCGVDAKLKALDRSGKWTELPDVALAADTAARLAVAMPGVVSGLDRHQWVRSGTCSGMTAERYFGLSLTMLDHLNASPVGALFSAAIGSAVSQEEVRLAFDRAFGAGAGERVRMRCRADGARQVVTGLTVGLSGIPSTDAGDKDLGALILAAGTTGFDCASGIVDAVGLQ